MKVISCDELRDDLSGAQDKVGNNFEPSHQGRGILAVGREE